MVSENADMALDDFISKNKITGRFGKGGRGGGKGGDRRGGGGRGRNDRGGDRVNRSGDRGAVNKRGGGGGGGFSSRRNRNLPDRWEHDMYSGGRSNSVGGGGGSAKLIVNNLDFGVTDADMEELFAEFGTLKKASILYDRTGRSTGSAEIEFQRVSDARQAKEQYHQVPLDGRAMNITMIGSESSGRDNDRRGGGGGGFRDRSPRGGGNNRRNNDRRDGDRPRRGGGGGGGRGGRAKKEEVTQEQLDAEMDDYLKKRE